MTSSAFSTSPSSPSFSASPCSTLTWKKFIVELCTHAPYACKSHKLLACAVMSAIFARDSLSPGLRHKSRSAFSVCSSKIEFLHLRQSAFLQIIEFWCALLKHPEFSRIKKLHATLEQTEQYFSHKANLQVSKAMLLDIHGVVSRILS